ncbi:CBS domain-containing protein [Paraburkholderia sabiae]|jgi:IMP dehydrogenase|uniref:CBS domain-containing protein n=1 Tax=Paraburkholderia sabiae TaxID=273251 RepID=A0ABU9QIK4_9BURK|nr:MULTISPECIES: CBS domain-containing protein [Paraburkholderia]WJZ76406.1 CBS domain-containing protein [Paraburkholderia sabiae]CAD6550120.1 Inosine-5'-monophosphate dehydrogenase [Paraburkholderia sabiae]CAG9216818.1 CBS domain-containing protein [Paraburkholderia sabiae]HKR42235.1 CBS domain-containing protein [Paraburkholderia sp.]
MASVAQFLRLKVSQAVWTTEASASVYDAIAIMAYRKVGALIVAHQGRLAGIVTERDYARKIVLMDRSSRDTPVRDIMSAAVRYVSPHQTTDECMAVMTEHRIRYLPVITAGQVIGMVSIGDLIKNQIAEQEHTIRQLEHYIHGNGFHAGRNGVQTQSAQL